MTDDREPRTAPRPISGGSTQEAELPSSEVAWRAKASPSESPFAQGLRRLRKVNAELMALLRRYQHAMARQGGRRVGLTAQMTG